MKLCLVVDDSDVIRKVARALLESMGFDVVEASDGPTAIELCQTRGPAVVLLDWDMPDISGIACLETIGSHLHAQRPVIVYCTTENDLQDVARARQAGADAILMKPFDRASLAATLDALGLA